MADAATTTGIAAIGVVGELIGNFLKKPGVEAGIFGLILVLVILLEPLGIYGRWLKSGSLLDLPDVQGRHLQAAEELHAVGAAAMSFLRGRPALDPFRRHPRRRRRELRRRAGRGLHHHRPNGAGKTTIFNLVSRIYEPTAGRLSFNGTDITNVPPHQIAALGIARTFQNIELFEHATLLQNLLLARHAHKKSGSSPSSCSCRRCDAWRSSTARPSRRRSTSSTCSNTATA